MPSKKQQSGVAPNQILLNGAGRGSSNDLHTRAAFTSAIVAALKELECKKAPEFKDLGQRAYQKLQYDLPLVSPEELDGLTDILRASLQLKSGQPLLPITSKLLENVVTGARAPVPVGPASLSFQSQSLSSVAAVSSNSEDAAVGTGAVAGPEPPPNAVDGVLTPTANCISDSAGVAPAAAEQAPAAAAATQDQLPASLVDTGLLNPDRARLCGAFRALCAVIFVQLVSHALAVSEQDTWGLLYGIGTGQEDGEEGDGSGGDTGAWRRERAGCAEAGAQATTAAQEKDEPESSARRHSNGGATVDHSSARHDLGDGSRGHATTDPGGAPGPQEQLQTERPQPSVPPPQQPRCLYEEPQAAEEDGDDFIFEDLEAPCSCSSAAAPATGVNAAAGGGDWGRGSHPTVPPPPPPYSWPELRTRLLRLSGHVSYALLDEPDLWRDGQLLQGVFQLLRALGAHRHCQELQPLLHAYVGLVADRIAAEPAELACLDSLWDAVGLHCVASLPQVGRQRAVAGAARGGQGLLMAEATTCLSLVATLAGQLTGASAKLRLWQQVHKHMLPLLERCLAELARAVGPGPRQAAATAKAAAQQQQQQQPAEPKAPGPEEVAAIVLVCQVLDFYVQQRPGNADLAGSLKGTGVLASLSVLFAAAAALPGAEPLRSAALCCAASSRELHAWMLAVPGLAKALAGPSFQENGTHEAHGAVWELLGNNGSSPLALSILAGGAAPEKAVRVHALLQLLARAAACRGGHGAGCGGLWSPAVERAMRELFAALRQEQAVGGGAMASGREQCAAAVEQQQQRNGVAGGGAGGRQQGAETASVAVTAAVAEEEDDDDDDKLHLLEPEALQRRRARQLYPACWRVLKQLLTASGESSGKTD